MTEEQKEALIEKLDKASKLAKKDALKYYQKALKHMKHIPPHAPLVLLLQLNIAVYHAEVKKDLNTAIENLEHVLLKTFENTNIFAMASAEMAESKKVISLMRKNMAKWNE